MYQFNAGEIKTATITLTNNKAVAMACTCALFMGDNFELKAEEPFTLEAQGTTNILVSVIMPIASGVYPVYVGIFSNGELMPPLYRGSEDIEITAPFPDFVYTELQCDRRVFVAAPGWMQPTFSIRISNQAATRGTRTITLYLWFEYASVRYDTWSGSWAETLDPGESVVRTDDQIWPTGTFSIEYSGIPAFLQPSYVYTIHIEDDAGASIPECSF